MAALGYDPDALRRLAATAAKTSPAYDDRESDSDPTYKSW
jgi:hypothetical protein